MGVASHLGINLAEYDARIRTFIPDYEEMLDVAAATVPATARTIVDLGTGTGALAARCARHAESARIVGIDADREILALAARRLGRRARFIADSFLHASLPACDVAVASFALHHVRTRPAKRRLYTRLRRAIRPGGRFISVDCHPSTLPSLSRAQFRAWDGHLRRHYSPRAARGLLAAWADEDVYVPLESEMALLKGAGFTTHLLWRKGAFAILVGIPS